MKRGTVIAGVGVLVIGALVYAAGLTLAQPDARGALAAGVLTGVAFQLLVLAIAEFAFPGNALAAYGVGLLGRLLLVIVGALVILPASGQSIQRWTDTVSPATITAYCYMYASRIFPCELNSCHGYFQFPNTREYVSTKMLRRRW